jgi:hypothetical protein
MWRRWFPLWFSLWPCFLGVFLPYCTFPGGIKLLNVFWETIYGIGLWVVDQTVGLSMDSRLLFPGLCLWPLVISTIMFFAGRKLQKAGRKMQLSAAIALIASSFLVVNLDRALQPPVSHLPSYNRLFWAVW